MATRKSNKTAHVLSLITNNKAADLPEETKDTSVSDISNQIPIQVAPELSNQAPVSSAPELSNQAPVSSAPELSNQASVSSAPELSNQASVSSAPVPNQASVLQMPIVPNQTPAAQQATLPILEISSKGNDHVSDIIKEKLLEELGETIEKKPTQQTTTEISSNLLSKASNETTQSKAEILKESANNHNSSSEVTPFEPFNFDESRENKEAMSINENLPNDATNNESIESQNANLKSPEENNSIFEVNDEQHISDKSYCYVNVMEKIVKDKVESFMKQFNMCTCSRCVADTMALTLTNLQPKYIVTSQENYFPLLNYYGNKFFASVTAELMKACMMVHENPHHENNER